MQLEFHQVDAFSDRPFSGNPAMVYRLDAWLADELMQKIAAEHNRCAQDRGNDAHQIFLELFFLWSQFVGPFVLRMPDGS